jgi:hypothetical protein
MPLNEHPRDPGGAGARVVASRSPRELIVADTPRQASSTRYKRTKGCRRPSLWVPKTLIRPGRRVKAAAAGRQAAGRSLGDLVILMYLLVRRLLELGPIRAAGSAVRQSPCIRQLILRFANQNRAGVITPFKVNSSGLGTNRLVLTRYASLAARRDGHYAIFTWPRRRSTVSSHIDFTRSSRHGKVEVNTGPATLRPTKGEL